MKKIKIAIIILLTFISLIGCSKSSYDNESKVTNDNFLFTKDYTYYDLVNDVKSYYTGSSEQNDSIRKNDSIKSVLGNTNKTAFDKKKCSDFISAVSSKVQRIQIYNFFYAVNPGSTYWTRDIPFFAVYDSTKGHYIPFWFVLPEIFPISELKADIKSRLRDPNSLEIYSINLYQNTENNDSQAKSGSIPSWTKIEVDFGAKNGFGGMVRSKMYYEYNGTDVVGWGLEYAGDVNQNTYSTPFFWGTMPFN